jgi:acetyl-CoA carboxylase biotin carboxyl carrier protein
MLNFSEIKELIKLLDKSRVSEVEITSDKEKVHIKKQESGMQPVIAPQPAPVPPPVQSQPAAAPPGPAVEEAESKAAATGDDMGGNLAIKSPIVGTYYESPKPGSAPFVRDGDKVTKGMVVCIVEAMKIMNEIESEVDGTVVKRCVKNEQPVEYGQVLFYIKP